MERAGFEPAKQIAKDLQSSSFGHLDTSNKFSFINNINCLHVGTRTLNLWFKRPLLYQLSYVIEFWLDATGLEPVSYTCKIYILPIKLRILK